MIEYVTIVGGQGMTEAEQERCFCECSECGSVAEEHIRVDDVLYCVECAVGVWNDERAKKED
jgi:hypothetical protein